MARFETKREAYLAKALGAARDTLYALTTRRRVPFAGGQPCVVLDEDDLRALGRAQRVAADTVAQAESEADAPPLYKKWWDKAPRVSEVYISTAGDESVGIRGDSITIRDDSGQDFLGLDGIADEDQVAALEDFRRGLVAVFTEALGEPAGVIFDFECADDEPMDEEEA